MKRIKKFKKQTDNSMKINMKKQLMTLTWGKPNKLKLISKAGSIKKGWMTSTRAMEEGNHVIVQISTCQRSISGEVIVGETFTIVENARVCEEKDKDGKIINRWIGMNSGRYCGGY